MITDIENYEPDDKFKSGIGQGSVVSIGAGENKKTYKVNRWASIHGYTFEFESLHQKTKPFFRNPRYIAELIKSGQIKIEKLYE